MIKKKRIESIIVGKVLMTLLFLIISVSIHGQQQAGHSLYNQLAGLYNPSAIPDEYTNYQQNLIVGLSARTQWTKLNSSPKTQSIKLEYISDTDNTFNLMMGGYIINDKAGPVAMTGVHAKLATIMSSYNPEVGGFSAGLQFGMTQHRINTQTLYEKYPDDIITSMNTNANKPSLSIGVSYYNIIKSSGFFKNSKFNAGLSVAQLGFGKHEFSEELKQFSIFTEPHLYAYAKIRKPIGKDKAFEINSWAKYVSDAPANFDLNVLYQVNRNAWLEMGTNSSGIAHVGVGLNIFDLFQEDLLKLTYVYSPSFFKFGSVFGNSHELVFKYAFRAER